LASFIIPTDCDPCPGKMKATGSFGSVFFGEGAAGGAAAGRAAAAGGAGTAPASSLVGEKK
jgi:hypothetical protein